MEFIIDKQTFADLEICDPKGINNSIFKIFDKAITNEGRDALLDMFYFPLADEKRIRERQELINYIYKTELPISIDKYLFDFIEVYLQITNIPMKISPLEAWYKAVKYKLKPTTEYYIINRGIVTVIEFLQEIYSIASEITEKNYPNLLKQMFSFVAKSIENSELKKIIGFNTKKRTNVINREKFDYIFRFSANDRLKSILKIIYKIDAFQAVAKTKDELGLIFPEIIENKEIEITGLYHPFVKNAVANDITFMENSNLFLITGANMSGKSTFLKAFGVAVFLAHIGFPVPAVSMKTGVFNGLFSTINIADNLKKGYSHFYAEVLRVKNVAEEIKRTKNVVVIFDELFRGTNEKDANEASLAIITELAKVKGSVFLVSTHIMELAKELGKLESIRFGSFHTVIEGNKFINSYRLLDGICKERLGMLIIKNERIIETIKDATQT